MHIIFASHFLKHLVQTGKVAKSLGSFKDISLELPRVYNNALDLFQKFIHEISKEYLVRSYRSTIGNLPDLDLLKSSLHSELA